MYKRSPILRAALSPSRKEVSFTGRRSRLTDKIDKQVSRIRILSGMETVGISEGQTIPIETPITSVSYGAERDASEIPDEIHKIQATVTELIGLFQQYREVIDARVDNIKSELESYINATLDRRLNALKHDLPSKAPDRSHDYPVRQMIESVVEREMTLLELKRPLNGDVHRIREELARVKEDQARLVDKIRRINQLNCESHLKSLHAVESIRDLINSRP